MITYFRSIRFYKIFQNHGVLKISIICLVLSSFTMGCASHSFDQVKRFPESEFPLNSPNFEMEVVLASGEASCFYILFTIPLCKNQNLATIAWNQMRQQAQLEGKSAQFVNVFEDSSLRWNVFYIFYGEYYSVSANAIVYK